MRLAYCLAPPLVAAAGATLTFDPAGVRPWPRPADDPERAAAGLDADWRAASGRTTERDRVGADLAGGRLTADQAGARMAELNRGLPAAAFAAVRQAFPRATDEAVGHWQAVRFAARADPAAYPELAAAHRRRFPGGPDPDFPSPPSALANSALR